MAYITSCDCMVLGGIHIITVPVCDSLTETRGGIRMEKLAICIIYKSSTKIVLNFFQ